VSECEREGEGGGAEGRRGGDGEGLVSSLD
jgi:hypothetical protein